MECTTEQDRAGSVPTADADGPDAAGTVTSRRVDSDFPLTSDIAGSPWGRVRDGSVIERDWRGEIVDDVWRTEVRSLWTEAHLYVLFVANYDALCVDPSILEDEHGDCFGIWDHDVVEMFIGDDSDIRKYYEFVVSPVGQKIDIRHDKNLPEPRSRFGVYTSSWQVMVNDQPGLKRWTCQFRIPWSAISHGPVAAGKQFRANFYRCTGDNKGNRGHRHYLALNPTGTAKPNFHIPERFGRLVLTDGDVSLEAPETEMKDDMDIDRLIRQRPFAYSEIYTHPPLPGMAFGGSGSGELIKDDIPDEIARVCKNESNGTVFLSDGTWVTTWGQGRAETHPDERIVCSLSGDMGKTWSEPTTIVESIPEAGERQAYGLPLVVPGTDRVYLFYIATAIPEGRVWAREGRLAPEAREYPLQWSGHLYFVYSDDRCKTWSERHKVDLPPRDINTFPDRWHAWVNHPGQVMPSGEAIFTFGNHPMNQMIRRRWQLTTAEANVVRCDNILTEQDPGKLTFTLLPRGPRGIRTDPDVARECPALQRLAATFDGDPHAMAHNFQEMTVVALSDGRWVGVGRSFLGSPAYTVSTDRGETWSPGQPLCYGPGKEPIRHPMTMCPIAPVGDGRYVLLFTNNDGSQRGAKHVWDGEGRTRNPQWFAVARELPGEERNGGLLFGEPRVLIDVDDSGEVNLKTGISMPQFFARDGRYFVAYNINKEHLLLDEIPAEVLDAMTPGGGRRVSAIGSQKSR